MTDWIGAYTAIGIAYACWDFLLNCRDLDAQRVLESFGYDPTRGIIFAWFMAVMLWPILFVLQLRGDGRWKG